MDIRTKLVLALISSALLSMAALGYLTYLLSFDLFLQNSSRQLAMIASSKAREVDHLIDHWLEDARYLAGEVEAHTRVDAAGVAAIDSEALVRVFQHVSAANSTIIWIGLYDAGGDRLLAPRPDLAPSVLPPGTGSGTHSVSVHRHSDNVTQIILTIRVPSGSMAAAFDGVAFDQITSDRTGLGETGESLLLVPAWFDAQGESQSGFLILNPTGRLAESASGNLADAPVIIDQAFSDGDSDLTESDYLGTPVIASIRSLREPAWRMVIKKDASEEHAGVDTLLDQMRSLGLSLGAIVIFAGILFGVYLARRIMKLAETVERVRHGELELRAEVEGADEIALLATSFNEFLDQLDRSSDIFQLGALRVLVAEANSGSRHLLNELLTNWHMRAVLVTNGKSALEAIDRAEQESEPVQLMVLDENMPEMDGVQLVKRLSERKDWARCPIIMLSSDPDALEIDKLRQMGVSHIVPKPVIASDLMEAILEEMGVSSKALEAVSDADVFLTKAIPRKILLVEDSPIIQRVTVGFLERWGHLVTVAENGQLALDFCRRERFDLILMDLEMPVMNGLEATRAIRREQDDVVVHTPIIALTAKATKEDREQCMAAGMNDYIAKPIDPKVLYHLVDSYPAHELSGDTPITSSKETPMTSSVTEQNQNRDGPVDWQVARTLTGGDEALLDDLIELFPGESAKNLNAIRAGIDTRDLEGLVRGAHSLKSSARFFGAEGLVAKALEIENLGNASSIAEIARLLPALEMETARLVEALEQPRPPAEQPSE